MNDQVRTKNSLDLSENFASSARRIITIDVEKYQSHLDGMDISDERKEEVLRAMFSIVMAFVDLGFSVHPLEEVCGKDAKGGDQRPTAAFDRVDSKAVPKTEPKIRTGPEGRLEVK